MKKLLPYVIFIFMLAMACNKDEPCDNLMEAKLFYMPSCATINGYVTIVKNGETYIFQEEIDEEFQKDSIDVLIAYNILGTKLLTAECIMAPAIRITCLSEN